MTAEIRQDHAVAQSKLASNRRPEFVIGGKRMKQNDRRTIPENPINNFSVTTFDA